GRQPTAGALGVGRARVQLRLPLAPVVSIPVALGLVLSRDRTPHGRSRPGQTGTALFVTGRAAGRLLATHAAVGQGLPCGRPAGLFDRPGGSVLYVDRTAAGAGPRRLARVSGDQGRGVSAGSVAANHALLSLAQGIPRP